MHTRRPTPRTYGKKKRLSADPGPDSKKAPKRSDADYPRLRCVMCGCTIEDWRDGWVVWGEGRRRRDMTKFRVSCASCRRMGAGVRLGLPTFVAFLLGSPADESMTPKALVGWLDARGLWERDYA